MTTVSNISIGAKTRRWSCCRCQTRRNEAIARLSTGKRSMYGGEMLLVNQWQIILKLEEYLML